MNTKTLHIQCVMLIADRLHCSCDTLLRNELY